MTVFVLTLACMKPPVAVVAATPAHVSRPGPMLPDVAWEPIAQEYPVAVTPEPTLRDSVAATVRKGSPSVRFCYQSRLKVNPELAGRVEIAWTLANGRITASSVHLDSTHDPELARCVLSRVRSWTFEPALSGDVRWPFVFKSQG
jgi:hypothetical protein